MKYYDTSELLKSCTNEELQPLVDIIKKSKTSNLSSYTSYKNNKEYPKLFADAIYHEIRKFGGNTFANLYRKQGIEYFEVVNDVAKKVKIKKKERATEIIELERQILAKVLETALDKLSEKDKEELYSELDTKKIDPSIISGFSSSKGSALTFFLIKSPILMEQIINVLIKIGLKQAATATTSFVGSRALTILAGPPGWILGGLLTIYDISGPAMRVTMPCVIHIAAIRLSKMNEENNDTYNKYL